MRQPDATSVRYRSDATTPIGRVIGRGYLHASAGVQQWRDFPHYAIVYLLAGSGFYEDRRTRKRSVVPGDLLFVFPGHPHRYGPERGRDWSEIHLVFDGPVFDLWVQHGILSPAKPVIHVEPLVHWTRRMNELLPDRVRPGNAQALEDVCRMQALLADLLGWRPKRLYDDQRSLMDRACALLDTALSPDAVAGRLGLGHEAFRKQFQRLTGTTPARYRAARLIDRACAMMHEGLLTDQQISDTLGFCDPFHFSKRFKQITGHTPRAFRALLPGGT